MVGSFRKLAFSGRSSHRHLMGEGGVMGGKSRIDPAAALHGVPLLESFEAVEHPAEPTELDFPVRCPPPEKSIMQDGLLWRERVASSRLRPIERISTWQQGDAVKLSEVISNKYPGRPDHSNLRETSLLVTHSAPESAVSRMLV